MRVLMDIQALGDGHIKLQARRGIFRYIENLAESLIDRKDLDVTFCSSKSWHHVYHCHDYLESDIKWERCTFAQPDAKVMRRLSRRIAKIDREAKFESTGLRSVTKKAAREVLRTLFDVHSFYRGDVLDLKYLPGADIFHSPHFFSMPARSRQLNCSKNFVTLHDIIPLIAPQFESQAYHRKFRNRLEKLNREDWVFTVSQFTADDLCNYADNIDPAKVMPVPLAAADHFWRCEDQEIIRATKARYDIPEQGTYLLSLSAIESRKNLETTIKSFQNVVMQEKMDDLILVLVGQEIHGYRSYLEGLVASAKMRDRIIFTGFIPDEDLSPIYSGAAAFLFPSFYEGFGLPPLEAMKCGTPVIASNLTSIPEVVGDAGILIDPESVDELSQAVLRVLGDSDLRQELSEKSLARAAEFSWEKHAEMTVAGYRRALDS